VILIIIVTIVTEQIGNQNFQNVGLLYFPPHLTSASAIPGEMKKHKIASFHSNAQTSTSRWLNLFSLVTCNSCSCCCM